MCAVQSIIKINLLNPPGEEQQWGGDEHGQRWEDQRVPGNTTGNDDEDEGDDEGDEEEGDEDEDDDEGDHEDEDDEEGDDDERHKEVALGFTVLPQCTWWLEIGERMQDWE